MSIYKRKNSKYYYCEISITGRKVIRSTKTSKKSLALRFESQLRETLYRQLVLGDQPVISLSAAIENFRKAKQGAISQRNLKAQIQTIKAQVTRVYPLSGDLNCLNGGHLARLVALRRQDGVAEGTIRLMLTTLKGVIEWTKAAGFLQPANLVMPKIRVSNARNRVLTDAEEARLLDILSSNMRSVDDYDLVVLLLDTAARLNEIQQLRWENVDLKRREIRLWRSKTKTETLLKLTDRSLAVLKSRYDRTIATGLLFPSRRGGLRYTTPKSIQNAYKKADLDNFCTHSIRHSTASKLVRNGMSLFAVSKLLGHSSVTMSQRYSHLEQAAVAEEAVEILNKS